VDPRQQKQKDKRIPFTKGPSSGPPDNPVMMNTHRQYDL
jgi:hypothetical protein